MAAQPPSRPKVSAPVAKRSPHTMQRYTGTVVSKKMLAEFIELEVKFLTIENLSAESGVRLGPPITVPSEAQSAIVFVSTKTDQPEVLLPTTSILFRPQERSHSV